MSERRRRGARGGHSGAGPPLPRALLPQPSGSGPPGLGRPVAEPAVWRRGRSFPGASRRPHRPHLRLLCPPNSPHPPPPSPSATSTAALLNQHWGNCEGFVLSGGLTWGWGGAKANKRSHGNF